MDIRHVREEYTKSGLKKEDMLNDPLKQFNQWYQERGWSEQPLPNAMSLVTASKDGVPSVRTVLLKAVDEKGFTFFTNYTSDKAKDIAENPHVALLFFWPQLERQIIIKGIARKVSADVSKAYFLSRPYLSQLGAWCSHQSQVIANRALLDEAFETFKQRFIEGNVPYPEFWGGYHVQPTSIEFWQGRANRVHDRLRYQRSPEDNWIIKRLSP